MKWCRTQQQGIKVYHKLSLALTLQRTLQYVWVSTQSSREWIRPPTSKSSNRAYSICFIVCLQFPGLSVSMVCFSPKWHQRKINKYDTYLGHLVIFIIVIAYCYFHCKWQKVTGISIWRKYETRCWLTCYFICIHLPPEISNSSLYFLKTWSMSQMMTRNMFVQASPLPWTPQPSVSHSWDVIPLWCMSWQSDEPSILPLHVSYCSWVSKAPERKQSYTILKFPGDPVWSITVCCWNFCLHPLEVHWLW